MDHLNVTFDYDEETDILEISLGTGEPSYSEEVDDIVIVNRGYFSGQITGFQILDIKLNGIKQVNVEKFIAKAAQREKKVIEGLIKQRSHLPNFIGNRMSSDTRLQSVFVDA